jgi:hypothetical protein
MSVVFVTGPVRSGRLFGDPMGWREAGVTIGDAGETDD